MPGARHRAPGGLVLPRQANPRWVAAIGSVLAGLLGVATLVGHSTESAFSSKTNNPSNSWASGSVVISDDDTGSAMFSAAGLYPGATGSRCITVSYTGTLASSVKVYATAVTDPASVAQYLDLTIIEGTGGGYGSCAGFSAGPTIYTGTLAGFDLKTSFGAAVGSWSPGSAATRTYRLDYTLNAATPANKQGSTTAVTFQWESQA